MLKAVLIVICTFALLYAGCYLIFAVSTEWLRFALAVNVILVTAGGITWAVVVLADHTRK